MGEAFRYQPKCTAPGCSAPATYKLAASWSDGPRRELKNYGLSCAAHRQTLLERAKAHRAALALTEGESVGEVAVYEFAAGKRDADLKSVTA